MAAAASLESERQRLEQELASAQASVAELHLQLFGERRDVSQLRKEVASLRLGLDTANDMLDSNKVALGRSEAYGQVLKVSKDQLQERFEREQREHEDCRLRLERLQEQLQAARAKDPVLEAQIKVGTIPYPRLRAIKFDDRDSSIFTLCAMSDVGSFGYSEATAFAVFI